MKQFKIVYSGNSSEFADTNETVLAVNARQAVIDFFSRAMPQNYFPQEDGSILDCDGHIIAESDDDGIEYDGGYFEAIED